MRPCVLLLDEPTAGLDPTAVGEALAALTRLQQAESTIVMSTHDVDLALRWADEVAVVVDGGVVQGPPDVVLGDDALLRRLNRQWRGQDKPTNVLAFPTADGAPAPVDSQPGAPLLLGDVILAFGTVADEAVAQGKALADHFTHLVVHGVLHLLGFDHEEAAAAMRMEALETAVLARLGIADPYRPGAGLLEARHG
jgi:rRNA maturation RNase YbeY